MDSTRRWIAGECPLQANVVALFHPATRSLGEWLCRMPVAMVILFFHRAHVNRLGSNARRTRLDCISWLEDQA